MFLFQDVPTTFHQSDVDGVFRFFWRTIYTSKGRVCSVANKNPQMYIVDTQPMGLLQTHKDPFTMVKTMQAKPSIKRTSKKPLDGCTAETKRQKSTTHLVTIHIFQLEHFCTIMRHAREKESGLIRFSWGEMLLRECWLNDFHIVWDSDCRCTRLRTTGLQGDLLIIDYLPSFSSK